MAFRFYHIIHYTYGRRGWGCTIWWTLNTTFTVGILINAGKNVINVTAVLTQCGNFWIFLSLRIYVKSILEKVEVLNLPFFAILSAVNLVFVVNFSLKSAKNHKNKNSRVLKWQILHFGNPQN